MPSHLSVVTVDTEDPELALLRQAFGTDLEHLFDDVPTCELLAAAEAARLDCETAEEHDCYHIELHPESCVHCAWEAYEAGLVPLPTPAASEADRGDKLGGAPVATLRLAANPALVERQELRERRSRRRQRTVEVHGQRAETRVHVACRERTGHQKRRTAAYAQREPWRAQRESLKRYVRQTTRRLTRPRPRFSLDAELLGLDLRRQRYAFESEGGIDYGRMASAF